MQLDGHKKWKALDDIFSQMWTVRRNILCVKTLLTDADMIFLVCMYDLVDVISYFWID